MITGKFLDHSMVVKLGSKFVEYICCHESSQQLKIQIYSEVCSLVTARFKGWLSRMKNKLKADTNCYTQSTEDRLCGRRFCSPWWPQVTGRGMGHDSCAIISIVPVQESGSRCSRAFLFPIRKTTMNADLYRNHSSGGWPHPVREIACRGDREDCVLLQNIGCIDISLGPWFPRFSAW
jgi:hypothetical protein